MLIVYLLDCKTPVELVHYQQSRLQQKLPVTMQAAVTLRDAAVREWAATPKDDQQNLRGYVLHYVLRYLCSSSSQIASCITLLRSRFSTACPTTPQTSFNCHAINDAHAITFQHLQIHISRHLPSTANGSQITVRQAGFHIYN